jgi:hypothetical protein
VDENKKDMMGQESYEAIKKHPILKNPILIAYVITPIIVVLLVIIIMMFK